MVLFMPQSEPDDRATGSRLHSEIGMIDRGSWLNESAPAISCRSQAYTSRCPCPVASGHGSTQSIHYKETLPLQPVSRLKSFHAIFIPRLRRFVQHLPSQGITTAGNLFYGFLCVRILPKPEYAKFTVLFGFLGTLSVLSDISLSNSIIPLIGDRIDDLQWIADYVASLRQISHRLYLIVAPVAILAFPLIVRHQPWDWQIVSSMIAILLVAAWFARLSGAYGAVLIVRRDRKRWIWAQQAASLGTLALLLIFWAAHWLNAFAAILINVSGIVFVSQVYYFRARRLLGVRGHGSREKRSAIVHLALPSMPGAIFYAVQGQISVLLITIFGRTDGVANIGALGRLAQIYTIFTQMNPLLLEPYFAKVSKAQLKSSYFVMLAAASGLCLSITGIAAFFPKLFLSLLGPKYANLNLELLLVVATASIGYFGGVLYVVHCSRRFVYWWSGILTIVLTLILQIIYIWRVNLGTMKAVLTLGLLSAIISLFVVVLTGIYGFWRGPREVPPVQSESAGA